MTLIYINEEDGIVDVNTYKVLDGRLYALLRDGSFVHIHINDTVAVAGLVTEYNIKLNLLNVPYANLTFTTNKELVTHLTLMDNIRKQSRLSMFDNNTGVMCMHNDEVAVLRSVVAVKHHDTNRYGEAKKVGVTIDNDTVYGIQYNKENSFMVTTGVIGKIEDGEFIDIHGMPYKYTEFIDFSIIDLSKLIINGEM